MSENDLHERLYEAIDTNPLDVIGIVETALAERNAKIERLQARVTELQPLELGIKSLTTADGSIDMNLHMAHDMMRILVAAFVEILAKEGGPNYCELGFKLAGSTAPYTLIIRHPNGKSPAEVAVEQRQRAERAEAILRDLVDPDPCYFDHNGYCQAHRNSPPCAHARARDHLAKLPQPGDQPKGTT